MPWINAPLCDKCWETHAAETLGQPGREPVRVKDDDWQVCHFCGRASKSGIYIRWKPIHEDDKFDVAAKNAKRS